METLKPVEIFDCEWRDGKTLWLDGIYADVFYQKADEWEDRAGWVASVQPTSDRCEWPELIAFEVFETEAEAMAFADEKVRQYDARYPHINYG